MGLSYVLITPARNEERYIRCVLESVSAQTCTPLRWVIVSDGSTDGTDQIIEDYCRQVDWIQLVRLPENRSRDFAAKVFAFNAGFQQVCDLEFDVVGNLDADISFGIRYFEFLLDKFAQNPQLGVAGTPFVEGGRHYDYRFTSLEHVSGACQLFRRACFEQIGGYVPIKGGGIDWTAVTTARMKGWQTRTFTEMTSLHHRPMGTASSGSRIRSIFLHGQKDYDLGGHPVWQLFRAVYQMSRAPYGIGGLTLLAGYTWAFIRQRQRPIPLELVRFTRAEQMARLQEKLGRLARQRG